MAPHLSDKVEGMILSLSNLKYSYSSIVGHLQRSGVTISKATVSRVVNTIGKRRQAKAEGHQSPKQKHPSRTVNSNTIRKVNILTNMKNPPTQREMAKLATTSQSSVRRIIKKLGKVIRQKCQVHRLLPRHIKNRKTNCRKLYEQVLAGQRSKFVVTLDEGMVGLFDCNGQRKLCYLRKGEEIPKDWVVQKDNFRKSFMVVAAITGRGTLPLIRVPSKVKVNADYYISHVLRPLLEVHLPKLYPGELSKVVVHHDLATSHSSKKTQAYARDLKTKLGVTIIPNSLIPVKSPDVSPLDFFGFGYLKRRLFRRRPKTMKGVWNILKKEWTTINQPLIDKTFNSWKRRLRLVAKRQGHHIENTKDIHHQYQ
jgi:hypothetical protein